MFVIIIILLIIMALLWMFYMQRETVNYQMNTPMNYALTDHHHPRSLGEMWEDINENDYQPVNVLSLISNPSKYNNQLISVEGVYSRSLDASVSANETMQPYHVFPLILAYPKSLLNDAIIMEVTPEMIVRGNPMGVASGETSKYNVEAWGRFINQHSGYGPNGQYGSKIILDKLVYHERVE